MVDDSNQDVYLFREILNDISYKGTYSRFVSGTELIDKLKHHELDLDTPSLMFIDFRLPQQTGYEIAVSLRDKHHYPHKIVITSAVIPPIAREPISQTYVDEWLEKAFDFNQYTQEVKALIEKYFPGSTR